MNPGVAIIGCGLIGQKRAKALGPARLLAAADVVWERAAALGSFATTDWREAIVHPGVDIVIVSTTNDKLAEIATAAINAGKHVLVEKPAARNVRELDVVIAAARQTRVQVRVGFCLRYHPALRQARELFASGVLGEMMFVRGRYGHGGRLG